MHIKATSNTQKIYTIIYINKNLKNKSDYANKKKITLCIPEMCLLNNLWIVEKTYYYIKKYISVFNDIKVSAESLKLKISL